MSSMKRNETSMKRNEKNIYLAVLVIMLVAFGFFAYYKLVPQTTGINGSSFSDSGIKTEFVDGKPVVRVYSTTWCPHCKWVGPTVDKVLKEYQSKGIIVARHWELDTGDDTLTKIVEIKVPDSELAVFQKANPDGSVPAFVFGKYFRLGNAFEAEKNLALEEAEFRAVIEKLLNDSKNP